MTIMHEAIDEMLEELHRDRITRRKSKKKIVDGKTKPVSEMLPVEEGDGKGEEEDEEEEGDLLFAQLQQMIIRDEYLVSDNTKIPNTLSPETLKALKELKHPVSKGKEKGKLGIKTGLEEEKKEEGEEERRRRGEEERRRRGEEGRRRGGEEGEVPLRSPQDFYPYWI